MTGFEMRIATGEAQLDPLLQSIAEQLANAGLGKPLSDGNYKKISSRGLPEGKLTIASGRWGGPLVQINWEFRQSAAPYRGGLDTLVNIDLGRNSWTAEKVYQLVVAAASGKGYSVSSLLRPENTGRLTGLIMNPASPASSYS